MSKSGSRYGRRSNWFKIHCLLQEQQQQAAAAQGNQKAPPSNNLNMLSQLGGFPYHRQATKEELMLLGLDEYSKRPSASPSVSSPDSHNSDSSVEIGDRRHNLLRQTGKLPDNGTINKDLFLPLPFPGLSSLPVMPPSGFLPPAHFLFPGYHPGLYPHAHPQSLLKPINDQQNTPIPSPITLANNNSRLTPNHNSKSAEEITKRFYLDVVLKSQQSPNNGTTKSEDGDNDESVTMTPPRSPCPISTTPTTPTKEIIKSSTPTLQENPIDLSIKTNSSSISNDDHRPSSRTQSELSDEIELTNHLNNNKSIKNIEHHINHNNNSSPYDKNDETEYEREVKRMKLQRTTPLDLTTKV